MVRVKAGTDAVQNSSRNVHLDDIHQILGQVEDKLLRNKSKYAMWGIRT